MKPASQSTKPERPMVPPWAHWCGWASVAIVLIGDWMMGLPRVLVLLVAAVPAAAWGSAALMVMRAEKRYEIDYLRWQISNVEGWISLREKRLEEGQPWFDDQDPDEWVFDQKYGARQSRDTLEELKMQLEHLEKR